MTDGDEKKIRERRMGIEEKKQEKKRKRTKEAEKKGQYTNIQRENEYISFIIKKSESIRSK
jgi:hypothetical protein